MFINDYWSLAIEYGAYGVHLGQDDLITADLYGIQNAGLRLGVSTHCYWEVCRAAALNPSYLAIGPIFKTTTKTMTFSPQGVESLLLWQKLLPFPLVAIGGIFLKNAAPIIQTGVSGIAVVREITESTNVSTTVQNWQNLLSQTNKL